MADEDNGGDSRLVAYIVCDELAAPPIDQLREHLREVLPSYMIPTAFVVLERIPLTPNGKADRRALPAPDHSRPRLSDPYAAPRNSDEEVLTAIWVKVLGVEQAGIHDNFFELGGHSLLATQVISHIRAEFGIDLPLRRLFESPTVASLAALIAETQIEQADSKKLVEILADIDALSEVEVEAMLADEG
jgi:acyl carrier protein